MPAWKCPSESHLTEGTIERPRSPRKISPRKIFRREKSLRSRTDDARFGAQRQPIAAPPRKGLITSQGFRSIPLTAPPPPGARCARSNPANEKRRRRSTRRAGAPRSVHPPASCATRGSAGTRDFWRQRIEERRVFAIRGETAARVSTRGNAGVGGARPGTGDSHDKRFTGTFSRT